MVVFDATMLMLLIRPESGNPIDSATGKPVDNVQERIAYFIEQSEKAKTRIGLPTPALSEVLVRSGSSAVKIVEKIKEYAIFEILPFDERCAIEVALMTKHAIDSGDKKSGSDEIWSKIKYDRQIAAIARVHQASVIYTDDKNLRHTAASINLASQGLADMQLPPVTAQGILAFEHPSKVPDEPSLDAIDEARAAELRQPPPV